MSFNNQLLSINKPKLVENNILKKIKKKKLDVKKNTKFNKIKNILVINIKNNYGIIIILLMLFIALYYRYIEVKNRRKKNKYLQNNYNNI
jgi:hypothetical protein